ncbi:13413_t:CDS:2, partial [Acaulospora morrowiae]
SRKSISLGTGLHRVRWHRESVKDIAATTISRVEVIKQAKALKIHKLRCPSSISFHRYTSQSRESISLGAGLYRPQDTKVTVSLDKRAIARLPSTILNFLAFASSCDTSITNHCMKEKDFIAPKDRSHDDYVTSRPMKEWHNIDSYVTKLLENNPGLSENDCFAVCCRSLSSLSNQVSDWPNSVSKYASALLSKWKGSEKQHWLELAKKVIQRKRDDEKISSNNAEIQQKKIIQHQRTVVSAINLVTEEIDELAPRKRQRGQEPRTPENKEGEPLNGMALRKTKKICYTEFSSPGSSDLEDVESTPCPTTRSVTRTLMVTPNKPIITKATYDEYSAHIICAFNTTIHLVKKTVGEQDYEKVKTILQMGNKLVMKDSIVEKLCKIFQSEYSEVESRIISETKIDDNRTTDEDRFTFFIRYALLDFVSKFKFLMPKVMDRDMLERSYIIEVLSPILLAFRKAFPDVKYMWVEKDVRSVKEANFMFMGNIGERKTDLLILRLSDAREFLNVEVSGPPYRSTKKHTVGDIKKLLVMAICSLCRLLSNNLDCNIEDAKNVKTYSIQVIGDRLTLFAVSLLDKRKYLAVELASCIIPFSFDAIACYMKIFNFFTVIRNEFVEQEILQRKIRSFIPTDNCSENLREWLHLPDDDISLVTEEDMDEIFL